MNYYPQTLEHYQYFTNEGLKGFFAGQYPEQRVLDAMRYSLLAGGKRIRPVLVIAFCRLLGGDPERALPLTCAIEMVHTYSLIHDDLPCMDDDDLRRGKPTNHVVYGEACAVLAGDGLLTAAFGLLSTRGREILGAEKALRAVEILSLAAGPHGMVGGQILDLDGEGKALTPEQLHLIHSRKTGELIKAACLLGVLAADGSESDYAAASAYAENLGLAFQIRDDMLDVIGDEKLLGKPVGSDKQRDKNSFAAAYGLEKCALLVERYTNKAIEALKDIEGDAGFLVWLAEQLAGRDK